VTVREVSNIFCICGEFQRAKNRALGHTAGYRVTLCLLVVLN